MKSLAQEKHNIELLKKKAPAVYAMYRTGRIKRINDELQDMRYKYKELSPQEQDKIKNHAIYLKTILTELKGSGDQTASDTPSETETL